MTTKLCADLDSLEALDVTANECPDCVAVGSSWVHLRACVACGHVGCCDSSPNRHARHHAVAQQHPVIVSAEEGEAWCYCYTHDSFRSP